MHKKLLDFSVQPLVILGILLVSNLILFGGVHMADGGTLLTLLTLSALLCGKILGVVGVVLLATAAGLLVLRLIRVSYTLLSLRLMVALGLGLAVVGCHMLFLAVIGRANIFIVLLSLLFLLYWARLDVRFLSSLFTTRIPVTIFWSDTWIWLLGGFVMVVAELGLIASMATLLNANYDSFHQYLTFPMTYLSHGGLTSFLWHPTWGFPQFGEMIFLFSATLFGVSGPFLLNYVLTFIFAWMVLQTLKNWGIGVIRYPVAVCIAMSPIVIALGFGYLKIEMIYYIYCLLVLVLIKEVYIHEGSIVSAFSRAHIVVGIFVGILFSLKYTAIFIIGSFFIALFLLVQEKKAFIKSSFFVAGIALLVFSPWLMKNWVVYKSPLYPIFQGEDQLYVETGKMCSQYFTRYANDDLILQHAPFLTQVGRPLWDNLQLLLFSMTHVTLDGALMMLPGVWFLFFLPLVIFRVWQWATLDVYSKFLFVFSGVYFLVWAQFLIGGTWYLFPALLTLLFFVSRGLVGNSSSSFYTKRVIVIAVIFSVVLLVPKLFQNGVTNSIRYANGDISLKEATKVVKSEVGSVDMYERINELLRTDTSIKIYGFMEPRGYFIHDSAKRFVLDYYGDKIRCLGSVDEVKQSFKDMGVRYIVANTERRKLCSKMVNSNVNELCQSIDFFDSFVQSESLPVLYQEGETVLYKVE